MVNTKTFITYYKTLQVCCDCKVYSCPTNMKSLKKLQDHTFELKLQKL